MGWSPVRAHDGGVRGGTGWCSRRGGGAFRLQRTAFDVQHTLWRAYPAAATPRPLLSTPLGLVSTARKGCWLPIWNRVTQVGELGGLASSVVIAFPLPANHGLLRCVHRRDVLRSWAACRKKWPDVCMVKSWRGLQPSGGPGGNSAVG